MMKDIILAVVIAAFLLISLKIVVDFLSRRQREQDFMEIISDNQKSENACRLMKESADNHIRLKKADARREKKSSCPRPGKLRQLLLSLLNAAITAGVSALIKSLIEGYMG